MYRIERKGTDGQWRPLVTAHAREWGHGYLAALREQVERAAHRLVAVESSGDVTSVDEVDARVVTPVPLPPAPAKPARGRR